MIYKWKSAARNIKGISPEAAGLAMEKTAKKNGGKLTAEALVAASKSEKAVLHNYFVWDDAVAGARYRENQASYLIRSIMIVREDIQVPEGEPPRMIRAFYPTETTDAEGEAEGGYEGIMEIMSDAEKRQALLDRAEDELIDWQKRYADLVEFSAVFEAIKKFSRRQRAGTGDVATA